MYEELKNNEQPLQAIQQSPQQGGMNANGLLQSPYGDLENGLKELLGSDFDLSDRMSQRLLLEHLRMNREQNEKLSMALEQDPRLAQMLADIVHGKRNAHSAMARYFGRSLMNLDEGTPEFEEMMIADEERREEVFRLSQDRREYEANLETSRPVIERFCKEHGYDPAEFMEIVWERLVFPILSGRYSTEVCTALDHAIRYEQDVEDAFAAGDVKGRNTGIHRMKADFGDGMPKGMVSTAPDSGANMQRRNSLLDAALEA